MRGGRLLIEVQNCHGHSFIPSIVVLALCSDLWNFLCVCVHGGEGAVSYQITSGRYHPQQKLIVFQHCTVAVSYGLSLDPSKN